MTVKTDLEANSADIAAKVAGIVSVLAELDVNIALVGDPEPCIGGLELRPLTCPSTVTTNYYPFEIQYHEGFLYVSAVGGNGGGSGNANLFKINPKTGTIITTYSGGSYASGHGFTGFSIHNGKAYVCCNKFIAGTTSVEIIDLSTMTLDASVSLGTGAARNTICDGTNIYIGIETVDKLKKFDIATRTVSDHYSFAASSKPFRSAFFDGKIYVALFNAGEIKVINTAGSLIATISTGSGSQPNWFAQSDTRLFCSLYGTHKAVEINSSNTVGINYNCPTNDTPHAPLVVMNKQLWLGGTTSPTSYIRIFDIDTGTLITSLSRAANIPAMAFDGGNVWNICANSNYIQRQVLDLVNT